VNVKKGISPQEKYPRWTLLEKMKKKILKGQKGLSSEKKRKGQTKVEGSSRKYIKGLGCGLKKPGKGT